MMSLAGETEAREINQPSVAHFEADINLSLETWEQRDSWFFFLLYCNSYFAMEFKIHH